MQGEGILNSCAYSEPRTDLAVIIDNSTSVQNPPDPPVRFDDIQKVAASLARGLQEAFQRLTDIIGLSWCAKGMVDASGAMRNGV
jgi:hypothetical protein